MTDPHHQSPNKKQPSSSNYEYNMSCFQPPLPQMNTASASSKNRSRQIKERLVSSSSSHSSSSLSVKAPSAASSSNATATATTSAVQPLGATGVAALSAGDAAACGAADFFSPRSTAAMALRSISQQEQQQEQQLAECRPHPSIKRDIHAEEESTTAQQQPSSSSSSPAEAARPVSQCSAETQLTGNNSRGGARCASPLPRPPPPPPHVPVVSSSSSSSSSTTRSVVDATPQSPSPYSSHDQYGNNNNTHGGPPPPPRHGSSSVAAAAAAAGVTPSPRAAPTSSSSHMAYYHHPLEQQQQQQHADYYPGQHQQQQYYYSRNDSYHASSSSSDPYHHPHAAAAAYQHHENQYNHPVSRPHESSSSARWWGSSSDMQPSPESLHSGYSYQHPQSHHGGGYHHHHHQQQQQPSHRSNAHDSSYHGHHHHVAPPAPQSSHPGSSSHPRSSLAQGHASGALGVGAAMPPTGGGPYEGSSSRSSYDFHYQQQQYSHQTSSQTMHNPRIRSHSQSILSTPPPTMPPPPTKKAKMMLAPDYSRKKKSLGVLAETFCSRHDGCRKETEIVVDTLAKELGVERRRIYDVVNIFEAVRLVVKKGKNTYSWMGTDHLPHMFALLQQEAIFDYPQDALDGEIIDKLPTKEQVNVARLAFRDPKRDAKSLSRLSQQFLQVFLVSHLGATVSLVDASDKIHGGAATQEELAALGSQGRALPDDPILIQKAAARGLKTKIRRLYDIANVFHAIGLLEKVDETEHKLSSGSTLEGRRPFYRWAFKFSTKDLRSVFCNMSQEMKESRCPFSPEPLVVAIKMEQEQTPRTYNNNNQDMLPPPTYSVQRTQDGGIMTPRALARIHGSAEKNHDVDQVIVMHSNSRSSTRNTSTIMDDQSASNNNNSVHHGVRRVSLPVTGASTPGNSMAPPPHSITPPTGNSSHVHHSSAADETLGAPPIEDDPITLGVGGSGSSNNNHDGSSSSHQHRHHHHYHRVSLPETI